MSGAAGGTAATVVPAPDSDPDPADVRSAVRLSLDRYFTDLDGQPPQPLHGLVMGVVEQALIDWVLARAGGNISHAAAMLGMNRNTLRKKMDHYALR